TIDGRAVVAGTTSSSAFPTISGAKQTSLSGASDAFVTRFAASGGSLEASTYLGGTGDETAYAVAVDASINMTITGKTTSSNFPTYNPFQSSSGSGTDAIVSRFNSAGTLAYSSYLGASGTDEGRGVALDAFGAAFVAGWTSSTNFPV